ncbi:hypothetical protein [Streptomyces sp. NBC_01235]|uniref:hypothetical protein n=1 Tax=Streptomyces sp. NBC_01235 TaxID=2903788 RepID=UPI002E0F23A3|nr:hypothetical protein OG289_18985 [Streptomyces sp. NBC_01235]
MGGRGGVGGARSATVRRLVGGLVVLIVSALLAVAAPGSAQAASASAASCTGRKVRTLTFSTGSVLVYKDGGLVCAYTVQKTPGTKRLVSVSVQARGHVAVRKARQHTRSSPVVKVYAGHRCVWVRGSVAGGSYSSGWILC